MKLNTGLNQKRMGNEHECEYEYKYEYGLILFYRNSKASCPSRITIPKSTT